MVIAFLKSASDDTQQGVQASISHFSVLVLWVHRGCGKYLATGISIERYRYLVKVFKISVKA